MHLCCPACGFKSPIEVFAQDKDARHFAALMGRVPPPLADLALRYLVLFAPAKHAMTFTRGRAMLAPLVEMIEAGRITRAKREWTVTLAQFEAGLQHMVERRAQLTLPLKTHGYLLEVLAGAADKIEAVAESKAIAEDRSGASRKAAEDEQRTDAAQWDGDRRRDVERVSAASALVAEMAGLKRLGMAVTKASLRKCLGRTFSDDAVEFALGKLQKVPDE